MGDIEKFIHNDKVFFPELIRIAIIHYQFETIHPFLDGNGRVGRLLIPLYLINKGLLKKPVLYLSDFLERNRNLYYDKLMITREKNDITQWCIFFLTGMIETARKAVSAFDGILQLQKQIDLTIQNLGSRAANAQIVINYMYRQPLINAENVRKITGTSMPSAYKLIADLERLDILKEITGGQRGRMYRFEHYLRLFR